MCAWRMAPCTHVHLEASDCLSGFYRSCASSVPFWGCHPQVGRSKRIQRQRIVMFMACTSCTSCMSCINTTACMAPILLILRHQTASTTMHSKRLGCHFHRMYRTAYSLPSVLLQNIKQLQVAYLLAGSTRLNLQFPGNVSGFSCSCLSWLAFSMKECNLVWVRLACSAISSIEGLAAG